MAASKEPKPLYLATSLKELNSKTTSENIQKANPKLLCKSADKLFLAAHDKIIERDQEHAYVLLLRYLDIVKVIRSSKEFKLNKKSFDGLLDGSKVKKALEEAETLSADLEKRYEAIKKGDDKEELLNDKGPNSSDRSLPNDDGEDLFGTSISPEQLYQLLINSGDNTLVVDCRTHKDYTTSHVDTKKYPQWLSIPEEVIKSGNLTSFMTSNNRKLWDKRGSCSNIILVDVKGVTEKSDSSNRQPILVLKEKLEDENLAIRILEGGYNIWYLTYSPLCVGKWKDKDIPKSDDKIKTGDELSYPTLPISNVEGHQVQGNLVTESPHDPPFLPQSANHHHSPPNVNRLTKPASASTTKPTIPTNHEIPPIGSNHPTQFTGQNAHHPERPGHQPLSFPIQPGDKPISYHTAEHKNHPGAHSSHPIQPIAQYPMQHGAQHISHLIQPTAQHTGHPIQPVAQHTGHSLQPSAQNTGHPIQPSAQCPVLPDVQHANHSMQSDYQFSHPMGPDGQYQMGPGGNPSNYPTQPTNYPMHFTGSSSGQSNGHPVNYLIGQSSHSAGQGTQPSVPIDQSNFSNQPGPSFPLLPPAPSVNLPLDLEGRGMILSQDLGPSPVDFMDDWYPSNDMNYSGSEIYTSREDMFLTANTQLYYDNPRVMYGPLPIPPSYQDAQHLPSHPPVQPPLPPPISVTNETVDNTVATSQETGENKVNNEQNKIDDQQNEDNQIEDMRRMMKEMKLERDKMMEELKEEREKDKAALAEERRQQELEFQQRTLEMEKKLKEQYEKERSAILKSQEEMKHYWESIQLENHQQRQVVINQGLPSGWEKRLDRKTGRFYYIDHSTHTTHWNPPTSLLQYQQHFAGQSAGKEQPLISEASKLPTGPGQPIPQYLSGYHGSSGHQTVPQVPPSINSPSAGGRGQKPIPSTQSSSGQSQQISSGHSQQLRPSNGNGQQPAPSSSPRPSSENGQQPTPPSSSQAQSSRQQSQISRPHIDRASKPNPVQPMPVEVYQRKILSLQPVQGGLGPGLTGLRNLGNTCFMSSVIQCLCSTPRLVQYFYSNNYRVDLNRSNPLGTGGILAEEFYILVAAMWLGKFRHISPQGFKNVVSQFASYFAGNQQHDCQEFLVYLLDGLHEDLNKILVKSYIEMPDTDGVSDTQGAEQAWIAHKKRNTSIVVDLFHGLLKSTITCLTCRKQKVMFEPFVSLSVPIPQGRSSCSYHDCMKLFTARELMTGSNKWFCPKCKTSRDSEKTLFIWRLPPVLLLHFKRFQDRGNVREKIGSHISFPLESLDLNPYIVGPKPTKQYNLFAISNHIGTLQSGHYTATCKNPRNQKFYYFNDHDIREATSKDLNTVSAYLLFYTCENIKI